MTAEVAILNKLAVALAADSAVTTGLPGQEKIFTSANKIFTLSKHAPVGVMIYGHVEHFAIPWETVIKQFRQELGRCRFPLVGDYVSEFQKFFSQKRILSERQQELSVLVGCLSAEATAKRIAKRQKLKWNSANLGRVFDTMEEMISEQEALEGFKDISYSRFVRRYNHILDAYLKDKKGPFRCEIPSDRRAAFKKLVYLSICLDMRTGFSSGVVVSGFGEDELFPTLKEIHVDGGIFDRVRISDGQFVDIGRSDQSVFVRAFAQEDVVEAFMRGYDEGYQKYMTRMLSAFMKNYTGELLREHTNYSQDEVKTIIKIVEKKLERSIKDFRGELFDFCRRRYVEPVEDVLRAAPKDELAHVAEALVSLTSLKRRVSGERETVGGPVDVAVISKGDGFIWIKRKHYFSQELNPHFVESYFTGVPGDERQRQAGGASAGPRRRSGRANS